MSQAFTLHRARQGDKQAIITLLNQSLNYKRTQIKDVIIEDNCLQLILKSRQVPNQHKLIPFLEDEVGSLEIKGIDKVRLIATVEGNDKSAWESEFNVQDKGVDLTKKANIVAPKYEEVEGEEVSLELRAKRGENAAILALINQELESKNITTEIRFKKGHLTIFIESEMLPEPQEVVDLIKKKFKVIKLPIIKKVTIYAKQRGEIWPTWHRDFTNYKEDKKVELKTNKALEVTLKKTTLKSNSNIPIMGVLCLSLGVLILGFLVGRLTVPLDHHEIVEKLANSEINQETNPVDKKTVIISNFLEAMKENNREAINQYLCSSQSPELISVNNWENPYLQKSVKLREQVNSLKEVYPQLQADLEELSSYEYQQFVVEISNNENKSPQTWQFSVWNSQDNLQFSRKIQPILEKINTDINADVSPILLSLQSQQGNLEQSSTHDYCLTLKIIEN